MPSWLAVYLCLITAEFDKCYQFFLLLNKQLVDVNSCPLAVRETESCTKIQTYVNLTFTPLPNSPAKGWFSM